MMVRIAGIDKDFTNLELMFLQADDQEKASLSVQYLANLTLEMKSGIELNIEMESGEKVVINTKIVDETKGNALKEKGEIVTIQRLCNNCHKPIKNTKRKVKTVCQC